MNKNVRTNANAGGWADIDIAVVPNFYTVRAQLVGDFAVHRMRENYFGWTVSHTRTGLKLFDFPSFHAAAGFAGELRRLTVSEGLTVDVADPRMATAVLKPLVKKIRDMAHRYEGVRSDVNIATEENYAPLREDAQP